MTRTVSIPMVSSLPNPLRLSRAFYVGHATHSGPFDWLRMGKTLYENPVSLYNFNDLHSSDGTVYQYRRFCEQTGNVHLRVFWLKVRIVPERRSSGLSVRFSWS